ncbi:hypothetical protein EK21DRAFT_112896 [Setomelanomma holmii]|uniref:Uncharacterized protein n=1 Tax=Setomelanomma holmii TaxID=210430 RepID=A0A9P4H8B7_9PLEO|nr:hypothetical protein EK21DRAFT_112896 [Setomelanomma holmii]
MARLQSEADRRTDNLARALRLHPEADSTIHAREVAPIESDGPKDASEFNLLDLFETLDRPEILDRAHGLSELLNKWDILKATLCGNDDFWAGTELGTCLDSKNTFVRNVVRGVPRLSRIPMRDPQLPLQGPLPAYEWNYYRPPPTEDEDDDKDD